MPIEVTLPSLGDDDDAVTGGVVSMWFAEVGDALAEGDDLVEITTDKAAFTVPCPMAGRLVERCVAEGDEVAVGERICVLAPSVD